MVNIFYVLEKQQRKNVFFFVFKFVCPGSEFWLFIKYIIKSYLGKRGKDRRDEPDSDNYLAGPNCYRKKRVKPFFQP